MLLDELVRQQEAAPPARDRLITMLFVVTALHALLILGVTFSAGLAQHGALATSFGVLLVGHPVPETKENTSADYLAEVNQHGSGTNDKSQLTESTHNIPMNATAASEATEDGHDTPAPRVADSERDVITTSARTHSRSAATASTDSSGSLSVLAAVPLAPQSLAADDGQTLKVKGAVVRELSITPNVRESTVAVYLDGWRRKIERVGTANYPLVALRRKDLTGNPILEVQILADGRLGSVSVQRTSGHPELDQAALAILRLAAPFDPFPRDLAFAHDALRLSYEWQFLGGELKDATMRITDQTH